MKCLIPKILNKLLDTFDPVVYITLDEKKIRIPFVSKVGYLDRWITESWMIDLLKNLLPLKEGAFIDIGANVGQTLIKLKCVDPDIQYFGFEPNPLCVNCAMKLIEKNGFENCEIIPVGISNKNEMTTLNCYDRKTGGGATIVENFRSQQIVRKIFVPVQAFEYVCKKLNLKKISIIKIDIEGSELEVIKSLKKIFRGQRPFVLCEILPVYSENNTFRKTRQEEIEKIIKTCNYKICRIEKDEDKRFKGLTCLKKFGIHSELSLCDYLFVPYELFEKLSTKFNLK